MRSARIKEVLQIESIDHRDISEPTTVHLASLGLRTATLAQRCKSSELKARKDANDDFPLTRHSRPQSGAYIHSPYLQTFTAQSARRRAYHRPVHTPGKDPIALSPQSVGEPAWGMALVGWYSALGGAQCIQHTRVRARSDRCVAWEQCLAPGASLLREEGSIRNAAGEH